MPESVIDPNPASSEAEAIPAPPPGLELIQGFGYALTFALPGIALAIPATGFGELWQANLSNIQALDIAKFVLLVALILLSVRWVDATRVELRLWLCWTNLRIEPRETTIGVIAIAFYLGLSMAFVGRPLLITGFFACGTAVNCWTQWVSCRFFAGAKPRTAASKVPNALTMYWRDRPHVLRLTILSLFSWIAFAFALTGSLRKGAEEKTYDVMAYGVLVASIVAAEGTVSFWRHIRGQGLATAGDAMPGEYDAKIAKIQALTLLLPAISFLGQAYFSIRGGTFSLMQRHFTVMYVDWLLVPFNYFAVRLIDWTRGARLFAIVVVSTSLAIATQASWARSGIDPGHLIAKTGVTLAAGWVHLAFSIIEMTLLVAFMFCRRRDAGTTVWASAFACAYFLFMGVSGYLMHHQVLFTDACVSAGGIAVVGGRFLLPLVRRVRLAPAARP